MDTIEQYCKKNLKNFVPLFSLDIFNSCNGDCKKFAKNLKESHFARLRRPLLSYCSGGVFVSTANSSGGHLVLEEAIQNIPDSTFLSWLLDLEMYKKVMEKQERRVNVIISSLISDLSLKAFEILIKKYQKISARDVTKICNWPSESVSQEDIYCRDSECYMLHISKLKCLLESSEIQRGEICLNDMLCSLCTHRFANEHNRELFLSCMIVFINNWCTTTSINYVKDHRSVLEFLFSIETSNNLALQVLIILLGRTDLILKNRDTGNHILPYAIKNRGGSDYFKTMLDNLLKREDIEVNGVMVTKSTKYQGCTGLMIAIINSNVEVANELVKHKKIDVSCVDKQGRTAMHFIAEMSNSDAFSEVVDVMLRKLGSNVNAADCFGCTPLMTAILSCNADITLKLLHHPDINITHKDNKGKTALYHIAEKEISRALFTEIVDILLEKLGKNVNDADSSGVSILMTAIMSSNFEIAKKLLKHQDIDVMVRDHQGRSTLQLVAEKSNGPYVYEEIVDLILSKQGKDVNGADKSGKTSLMTAILNENLDIARKLLSSSHIDLDRVDNEGKTAFHHALEKGYSTNFFLEILCLMLEKLGSNMNVSDIQGRTGLMIAIKQSNLEVTRKMLQHPDIDVCCTDTVGRTALHYIMDQGGNAVLFLDTIDMILNKIGKDINAVDATGNTAIHYCVINNHTSLFDKIMHFNRKENLVDWNIKNEDGYSVFLCADCNRKPLENLPKVPESSKDWTRYCKSVTETIDNSSILAQLISNEKMNQSIQDNNGLTLLLRTTDDVQASHSFEQRVLMLITASTSRKFINIQDTNGKTFLMRAIQCKQWRNRTLQYLLQTLRYHPNIKVNIQDNEGKTALMHVMESNCNDKAELLQLLLDYPEVDVNLKDSKELNLLMYTTKSALTDCVKVVASHSNVKCNTTDTKGRTALQLALLANKDRVTQLEMVRILASRFQLNDINCRDGHNTPLLHLLLEENDYKTIKTILENSKQAEDFECCLHLQNKSNLDFWDIVLEKIMNVVESSDSGKISAALGDLKAIVKSAISLPDSGVNNIYHKKQTVLHKAAILGCSVAWNIFLEEPVIDMNLQDDTGNTALMYAVKKLARADVRSLLCKAPKFDVHLKNNNDQTLLDIIGNSAECAAEVKDLVDVSVATIMAMSAFGDIAQVTVSTQFSSLKKSIITDPSIDPKQRAVAVRLIMQCEKELDVNEDGSYGEFCGMCDVHRRKLQMLHNKLVSELEINPILNYLCQKDIITREMAREIKDEKLRSQRCEKLLLILPHRGEKAYGYFLDALRHESVDLAHVAKIIEEFDPDKDFSISTLTSGMHQRHKRPSVTASDYVHD